MTNKPDVAELLDRALSGDLAATQILADLLIDGDKLDSVVVGVHQRASAGNSEALGLYAYFLYLRDSATLDVQQLQSIARMFAAAIGGGSTNAAIYFATMVYALNGGNLTDEAVSALKTASERGNSRASFDLALFYRRSGRNDWAFGHCVVALQQGASDAALLGWQLLSEGMHQAKQEELELGVGTFLVQVFNNAMSGDNVACYVLWQILDRKAELAIRSDGLVRMMEAICTSRPPLEWLRSAAEAAANGARFSCAGDAMHAYSKAMASVDRRASLEWCLRAANAGNVEASHEIGFLHLRGNRHQDAYPYIEYAANAGHPNAMYLMGLQMACGDFPGSDKDAENWLSKAAQAGHEEAREMLTEL